MYRFLKGKAQIRDTANKKAVSTNLLFQKSKKQKTIAWILLGSGLGIAATGGILQLNHENHRAGSFNFNFTGTWIAIAGGVVSLSAIPFFISSGTNKRKAQLMLKNESNPSLGLVHNRRDFIALAVKIPL